jgi:CheY-like chemotaxis protein
MPGMTGADLQSRLIADGYRIPIIFLSANCSEEDRNRVLNGGALCVLDKPLDEEILCVDHCRNNARGLLSGS